MDTSPHYKVFMLSGDLTLESVDVVRMQVLQSLEGESAPNLLLDMEGVEVVTTPGLGLLLELHRMLRERGGRLVLVKVRERVLDVVNRTQLVRVLYCAKDAEHALQLFAEK